MSDSSVKKNCIACGQSIVEIATLCCHCGSYQTRWRNELKYISTIIVILAISIGALSFVINNIDKMRKTLAWRDRVVVLTLSENDTISVANTGDGEVYLSDINVSGNYMASEVDYNGIGYEKKFSFVYDIYKSAKVGSVIQTIPDDDEDALFLSQNGWSVAVADTEEEANDKLMRSVPYSPENKEECIVRLFYVKTDPAYVNYSRFLGERMITFPVTADIGFFSIRQRKWVRQPIQVIGALGENTSPRCNLGRG